MVLDLNFTQLNLRSCRLVIRRSSQNKASLTRDSTWQSNTACFRGVIGTVWTMADIDGPVLARNLQFGVLE